MALLYGIGLYLFRMKWTPDHPWCKIVLSVPSGKNIQKNIDKKTDDKNTDNNVDIWYRDSKRVLKVRD